MADTPSDAKVARNSGIDALFQYPLMSALFDRRTRRIARGTSVFADGLSHTSMQPCRASRK